RERKTAPEAPTPNGRLVTVIGSRGGAGTTTVAVNLAAALAEQSPAHSVLLVDLDVYLGEIPLFLDFKPQYSWADLAANLSRVDDSFLRNVLYQHPNGMFVLPGPDATQGSLPAFLDVFGRVLELLRRMFDVVVIDAGQTVTELVQRTLGQSDTVLVVSQLSLPHLASTNKLMGVLRRLVAEPETSIHTVFNRYHKKSNISVHEAEQSLKSSISSTLQNDYQFVMSAMNQGQVFSQAGARHKLTKQMQQLAQAIIPESATAPAGKKKWFSK
ncbi:MAG: AAA family ATPase, partial [Thermodesulfobacteriota bacterium]